MSAELTAEQVRDELRVVLPQIVEAIQRLEAMTLELCQGLSDRLDVLDARLSALSSEVRRAR
jgi:outer membrane protein TolC